MVIIGASLDELTDVTIIITAIISTGVMEGGLSWTVLDLTRSAHGQSTKQKCAASAKSTPSDRLPPLKGSGVSRTTKMGRDRALNG
jgi:hypothetical protein